MEHYQVAVVGLGALGSATLHQLARQGVSAIGFEQFTLGHVRGASHDTSRILRHTYSEPDYVRLASAAYRDWHELESMTGEELVTKTGGLTFFPSDAPTHLDTLATSLRDCEVAFQVLDAADVTARWSAFRPESSVSAIWQEDSAIVPAARTTAVLQVLARVSGAVLRAECPVQALEPRARGVELRTASGTVTAERVVLCADAWTNKILEPLGAELPLTWSLEQVSYFQPAAPKEFSIGKMPLWIWEGATCYYGFPTYGETTTKAARDCSGINLDIEHRTFEPNAGRLAELSTFLHDLLPDSGPHVRTVTCQYTLTPDRDFVLGPLREHPNIFVALGVGHAFKFAPTIGRILADLAVVGTSEHDLGRFRVDRVALR